MVEFPQTDKFTHIFDSDLKYNEKVLLERGMMEVRASLVVKKAANDWRFAIFLDKPVKWTHFWNCKLISVNKYNTVSSYIFQKVRFHAKRLGRWEYQFANGSDDQEGSQ